MNRRKIMIGTISVLCILCVCISAFLFSKSGSGGQDEELLAAVTAAEEVILSVGVVPAEYLLAEVDLAAVETGEAELVPQEVKEELLEAKTSNLAGTYTADMAYSFFETAETALEASNDLLDFSIDAGVLAPTLISTQKGEDGEMVVVAEFIAWKKEVIQLETDDLYHVLLTISKVQITSSLIEQDGQWVVNETMETNQEFAPDTYSPLKGGYETLEEAVRAAAALNPEEENPF